MDRGTRVILKGTLEVEGTDVEHPVNCDLCLCTAFDRCRRVHRLQAGLNAREVFLGHKVRLVEQDTVSESNLLDCLVLRSFKCMHAFIPTYVRAWISYNECMLNTYMHAHILREMQMYV